MRRISCLAGGKADLEIMRQKKAHQGELSQICFVAMGALGLERKGDQHKSSLYVDEVYVVASR